ncbi:MAG: TetR family transcriptional regulator [Bacteroidetes bacterium]|nr:TetR family transcriptional regulator [Bacteroidota bacterium]MDA1122242.1 TetR family transcriptional regulator [Bacteroidota bacterium]
METVNKIIQAAVRLYNEKGLSNVTSRHIADDINISNGNLGYHFPNKEAIVFAVYRQMGEEMSIFYPEHKEDILNPVEHLHKLLVRLEEFQTEYRFFCLDLMDICRKYEKVNKVLVDNMRIRKIQMAGFFQKFVEMNYMKPEPTTGYYDRLQHTIRILLTFWKSQEAVVANIDFNREGEMVRHVWEILLPHFTAKGIAEYENVLKN